MPRLRRIRPVRRQRCLRQPARDAVIAVGAGNLLRHVLPGDDVQPMIRHGHRQRRVAARREAQRRQQARHLLARHGDAQQALDPRQLHLHHPWPRRFRVVVDDPRRHARASDLGHQPHGAVGRVARQLVPDPLFVPHARLRAQGQAAGGVADGGAVEDRRLQDHAPRLARDLRAGAAHDPRQADRLLPVGDDQHPLIEPALLVVDRLQRLVGAGASHHDSAIRNGVRVVRVHRLPELVHHVVGDVHHRRDGSHAGGQQPLLHPRR